MRLTAGFLILSLFGAAALTAPALSGQTVFSARRVPFSFAVRTFSRLLRDPITVDKSVPEVPVTVDIRADSRDLALKHFTEEASKSIPGLFYERAGDAYVFKVKPGSPPPPPQRPDPGLAGKVVFSCRDLALKDAVALLYRTPPGGKPVLPATVEEGADLRVTLLSSHNDEESILRQLVRQSQVFRPDLSLLQKQGRWVVGLRPPDAGREPAPVVVPIVPVRDDPDRKIVVGLNATPLAQALELVCDRTLARFGKSYEREVAPGAATFPVTFTAVDSDPGRIFEALLAHLKKQGVLVERKGERFQFSLGGNS